MIESLVTEGVSIVPASVKEKNMVTNHILPSLRSKIIEIYKVTNEITRNNFDNYCKENAIKKTKYLWHGSKASNWKSLLSEGFSLNKSKNSGCFSAEKGIYLATSANKSYNYTDKLEDNSRILALVKTAYGKPLDTFSPFGFTKEIMELKNKNCVHAHTGSSLENDEIIFFDENALNIEYLVELKD